MTLWENLFAVLMLAMLIPAIWMSQTHAYLVLEKAISLQSIEAAEIRVMEDVMHGGSVPQTVQEGGRVYTVHWTQVPDSQAAACQDQTVTLDAGGDPVPTLVIPTCTQGIFAS
ncbi:hypothetical protein [Alicyclobacillus sendaiensis]|uniref:Uncharacterized protein n=1 Tax=Alicyclobacillus sendaiensis PA2 TaxID=3029425 RepID=A0ABT6XXY4_ALISE|nr:hypothetical protein [Alicyclobacillus sendaiensis]MDI9259882.1 hypothetical protein [Alicyclobacillus sendaiensis PA2]